MTVTEYRTRPTAAKPPPRNGGYNGLATAIIAGAFVVFLLAAVFAYTVS